MRPSGGAPVRRGGSKVMRLDIAHEVKDGVSIEATPG
jgi:hypothetical protein